MRKPYGLLFLMFAACGSSSGTGESDTADSAAEPSDVVAELPDTGPDDIVPLDSSETSGDGETSGELDADETDAEPDAEPELGSVGDPCESNADCLSNLCVEFGSGGGVRLCTAPCSDSTECPEGFECVFDVLGGADAGRICYPTTFCLDADDDGFGVGPGCASPDCDDDDDSVNPGADEICDGLDNDCDERLDDNPILVGQSCATGFDGECSTGIWTCEVGELSCAGPAPTEELCDGLDNDCNGDIDDEAGDQTIYYQDGDSDGRGDAAAVRESCEPLAGFVTVTGDCDDTNAFVFEGAPELCDAEDNDCDGAFDEEIVELNFYRDADGDAFGDDRTDAVLACRPPDGYVAQTGDCDDDNAEVRPSALESVGDSFDQNCDGTELCLLDADADGVARDESISISSSDLDCTDPGEAAIGATLGDCNDSDQEIFPGATELCNGVDDNCDGTVDLDAVDRTTFYRDGDEDGLGAEDVTVESCALPTGYSELSGDCDDLRHAVFPGNTEICDRLDNDCDTIIDGPSAVDVQTWYLDTDADRYGVESATEVACFQPTGFAAQGGDCAPAESSIYPGAQEFCDTIDQDCDGETFDSDASDVITFYRDSDGDGFGDRDIFVAACSAPEGYVLDNTDCADSIAEIHPAAPELCDELDRDCDGDAAEADSIDAPTWYLDGDDDSYGDFGAPLTQCARPEFHVSNALDCDDSNSFTYPGAPELCDLVDTDCDAETFDDEALDASIWYADTDDDSFGDFLAPRFACSVPDGFVANSEDCDDSRVFVFPASTELCDGLDNDCDSEFDEDDAADARQWFADADGDTYGDALGSMFACFAPDGFVANSLDCDDDATSVNPAALETCNSVDDNCAGGIDEGETVDSTSFYLDADGDTYGVSTSVLRRCAAPAGYSPVAGDCDDSKQDVNPAAQELCNGFDDDCINGIDEGSPPNALAWYADGDSDNYGNPSAVALACNRPVGYVGNAADCNDGNGGINPGATENCNGLDENCNGLGDEPYTAWYRDADNDGYGNSADVVLACANSGGRVSSSGDCDDTNFRRRPGLAEVCDGLDNNCDGSFTAIDRRGRTVEYDAACDRFGGGNANDLCFGESWNGQGYMHCHYHNSFDGARAVCQARGMELADFNSAGENSAVIGAFDGQDGESWDDLWIGGRENGSTRWFAWVRSNIQFWQNGSNGQYANWRSGEPSNDSGGSTDDCTAVRQSGYNWNDRNCGGTIEFICEW